MLNSTPVASLRDAQSTPDQQLTIAPPSHSAIQTIVWQAWLGLAVAVLLLVGVYWQVGIKLFHDWMDYPEYSHGLLIPFFIAYLLWDRRRQLQTTPVRSSWAGLPLVAFGVFVLFLGIFGAELFLSRFSFVLIIAGLISTLFGRSMLQRSAFFLFVLVLAIPLPVLVLNHITFPLQLFASKVASGLLPLAGVPVLREGNVITLPAMPLEVAEACSGIRSLMSLFTVAVIYGALMERRTSVRVLLALASVPIAIVANVARIVGTGLCVQYWDPDKALGFFHEFSGWLMFLVSLACLYLFHKALTYASSRFETAG